VTERAQLPEIDAALFREALGHFVSGVTVITAMDRGEPVGLAANSFSSLSLDPPLVLFCAGLSSTTWPRIKAAGRFCVNVLEERQEALSRQFAGKGDKFHGVGWRAAALSGAPILDNVLTWIDCVIDAEHDAGDHIIVVGRVVEIKINDGKPLVYYRGGYGRYEV
jgi:3-hydroxy-9,10-secoandrosta-1,3,5(10)-triene-9,17-dione monooxygenase reductase component